MGILQGKEKKSAVEKYGKSVSYFCFRGHASANSGSKGYSQVQNIYKKISDI